MFTWWFVWQNTSQKRALAVYSSGEFLSFCWLTQATSQCDVEEFFVPNFFSCSHFGTYLTWIRSFCKFYVCFAVNIVFWLRAINAYCFHLCTLSWSMYFPASTDWWVKLMFSFVRFIFCFLKLKKLLFWAKNVYYETLSVLVDDICLAMDQAIQSSKMFFRNR